MTGDGAHQVNRATLAEAALHDHAGDVAWIFRLVFALEDEGRAKGRHMEAAYRAALDRHRAQLAQAEPGGWRDFLTGQVEHDLWAIAALVGRRAVACYQAGRLE